MSRVSRSRVVRSLLLTLVAVLVAGGMGLAAAAAAAGTAGSYQGAEATVPRIDAVPATLTVTMYLDQASAQVQRVAFVPADIPADSPLLVDPTMYRPTIGNAPAWVSGICAGMSETFSEYLVNVSIARPSSHAGTYYGHLTFPSGDARVPDGVLDVVVDVIAKTRAKVRLAASIPSGWSEGHNLPVSGSLHTSTGKDMGGRVSIQQRGWIDGEEVPIWQTVKTATLSHGRFSTSIACDAECQVRVLYEGTTMYRMTASAAKRVRLRVALSRPRIGMGLTFLKASSTYAVGGTCDPTHWDTAAPENMGDAPYSLKIQIQRHYAGRWRTEWNEPWQEQDGAWAATYRPGNSRKGRMRVVDVCGQHDVVYSPWKYFYIY